MIKAHRDFLANYCNNRTATWDNVPGYLFWTGLYDSEYKTTNARVYFTRHAKDRREWKQVIAQKVDSNDSNHENRRAFFFRH